MSEEKKKNRPGRLANYDYGSVGYYFITFCTKNRACILSDITTEPLPSATVGRGDLGCVGRDDLGAPSPLLSPAVILTPYGTALNDVILTIPAAHSNVTVQKYVIMPNHVHLLLSVDQPGSGAPGSSRPTQLVPRVIAYLKRVVNHAAGRNLWQSTYYDHIIRNEADYLRIWNYIDTNPAKWGEDEYYIP